MRCEPEGKPDMKSRSQLMSLILPTFFTGVVLATIIVILGCSSETDTQFSPENGTLPSNEAREATVTDIDGNQYQTVKIGNQLWFAENLKVTHYQNGDTILNIIDDESVGNKTTGAWCDYQGNTNNADTYGHLYSGYAVQDSRNICPKDWHVPNDAEWDTLIQYLGGESIAGGKMKESGTLHWSSPNAGATNDSGFSALPGGYCSLDNYCKALGNEAGFWSSTTEVISGYQGASRSSGLAISYQFAEVDRSLQRNYNRFSVRCVEN